MPQIELKQYVDEIGRLIDDGQVDAAIDHCRHILEFHPRYLPVYRLLAQASLEKGDYAHATHFLQSLLSADPENADAWATLATLSDDLGELEQATWLMERAFEIEPGDAETRERLRDLYRHRDGIDRPRLKLTPGALGRMYAVGGFHRRAIYELQRVLESRAGLPPLHIAYLEVALARAFCSAQDMEAMAERVCHSLLSKLPNCLQANLIMGQILWSRGQAEEAEKYLEIARALDPEGRASQELFGDRSPVPFERVQIPHLEAGAEVTIIEEAQVPAQPVEDISWLDHVGEAFEGETDLAALTEPAAEGRAPDWLDEWSAEEAPQEREEGATGPTAGREQVGQTAPLPAWMVEVQPEEGEEEAEPTELPAWLTEGEEETQPAEATAVEAAPLPVTTDEEEEEAVELPAWLQELASEAEPAEELEAVSEEEQASRWVTPVEEAAPVGEDAEAPKETAGELAADELPDWLKAFDEQDLEESAEAEELPSQTFDEELPEWMQTPALDAVEPGDEEETEAEAELPSWLRAVGQVDEEVVGLPADEEESPEVGFAASLDEEALPDWLRDLREQQPDLLEGEGEPLDWMAEDEGEVEAEIEPIEEDELPDWLRELRAQKPAVEEPPPEVPAGEGQPKAELAPTTVAPGELESLSEEELPEWLQELRAQEPTPEAEPPEDLAVEAELPDWLEEIEAEAAPEFRAETVDEEELPDWLRELRAQETVSGDEEEAQTLVEPSAEQAPDWLAEIQAEEEAELPAEAVDEEALPDWLRGLRAQEPSILSDEEEAALAVPEEGEAPDWLVEAEAEAEQDLEYSAQPSEGEELPDWLRTLQAAEEEPESVAPATVEPHQEPPQTAEAAELAEVGLAEGIQADIEMPQPMEGLPAWLIELEAEVAGQPPQAPGVQPVSEAPEEPQVGVGERLGAHEETVAEIGAEEVETLAASAVAQPEPEGAPALQEAASVEAAPSLEPVSEAGEEEPEPLRAAEAAVLQALEPIAEMQDLTEPIQAAPRKEAAGPVADLGPEPQAAELVAEPEPEPPTEEEEAPTPALEAESVGELPEAAEDTEPVPEEVTEELPAEPVVEGAVPRAPVDEELDWVRELEAPEQQEEPGVGVEAPDLAPAEAVTEMPPPEPSELPVTEPEAVPATAEVVGPAQRLSSARSHLAELALDDAAREYEQLVDTPSLRPELLEDLDRAVEAHPDHAPLLRVLGDVYVRTGQLQKALRAYRHALHNL
jgi:tetratricopeptide (TPR) repeat protein